MSDNYLHSFQEAFRPELENAVRALCPDSAIKVLDCPCGDGFYTQLFARNLVANSTLIAADTSPECIATTEQSLCDKTPNLHARCLHTQCLRADAYSLPFEDSSFDLVWCAQSFITMDDPVRALKEFARVVRTGGRVVVLETDEYHHVLLPWPISLELAVFRAVRAECRVRYRSSGKFAQARTISAELMEAGLSGIVRTTIVADRTAPFERSLRTFLINHFEYLRDFVRSELTPREFGQLEGYLGETDRDSFLNRQDTYLTCLATVCSGVKMR